MTDTVQKEFPSKFAGEAKVYGVDWSRTIPSDTISGTPTWSGSPAGLTFANETVSGKIAKAKVSGGTAGTTYCVTCEMITVTSGETLQVTKNLDVVADCS